MSTSYGKLVADVATDTRSLTRREFLGASGGVAALLAPLARLRGTQQPVAGGRFIRTLPLGDPLRRDNPPLNELLGDGLDARLFTDLSDLAPGRMITPADRFFVRTACPQTVDRLPSQRIAVGGRVRAPATVRVAALVQSAAPMGSHVLECAGNTNPNNYGLISAAEWRGVPIGSVLDRVTSLRGATRVVVTGRDDPGPSRTSVPGASWIFTREELERAGAFLATHMNGSPLARHHGAPVRLVVPGWYGCACIKWIDRIEYVDEDVEATPQMREFASRTDQPAGARLAREFEPATIDLAAMPIRVEQWEIDGRPVYRISGIVWGGSKPAAGLQIRVLTAEPWIDVSDYEPPRTTTTWSLWSHRWRPSDARRYHIVLRVKDPVERTRRLDEFFYVRAVDITDV